MYGKTCHLPVKLEHQAYWVIRRLNLDLELAGRKRLEQLEELDEFWLQDYENAKLYKERTKNGMTSTSLIATLSPDNRYCFLTLT